MRDNKSLCDLMENIKSESGGIIDFALIENHPMRKSTDENESVKKPQALK